MRSLIALGLTVCLAAPAAAQTEVIIRRSGQPDQVIHLDSARTRAALEKAQVELKSMAGTMEKRLSELSGTMHFNTEPLQLKTLALKDAEVGTQLKGMMAPLMRTIEAARRQPHLGIVVFTDARPESDKYGAYISAVTPGSPAERAGILAGDIMVRVAGKSLTEKSSTDDSNPGLRLISIIATLPVGKPVDVELRRDTKTVNVKVTPNDEPSAIARIATSGTYTTPSVTNLQRMTTDRNGADIMLRGVPAMPQQLNLFTSGNGDFAYAFGGNGLLANFELAQVNPKLGAYFGTSEGVLVVNDRMLEERTAAGAVSAAPAAPSRVKDLVLDSNARALPRAVIACDSSAAAGSTTIRCRGAGGAGGAIYLNSTPGMAAVGRRIAPVHIPLEPGDVIVSVDGRKVTSPGQLMRIVGTYEHNDEFKLQIMRQKHAETVTVKIP